MHTLHHHHRNHKLLLPLSHKQIKLEFVFDFLLSYTVMNFLAITKKLIKLSFSSLSISISISIFTIILLSTTPTAWILDTVQFLMMLPTTLTQSHCCRYYTSAHDVHDFRWRSSLYECNLHIRPTVLMLLPLLLVLTLKIGRYYSGIIHKSI